jgi:hypothetical protein
LRPKTEDAVKNFAPIATYHRTILILNNLFEFLGRKAAFLAFKGRFCEADFARGMKARKARTKTESEARAKRRRRTRQSRTASYQGCNEGWNGSGATCRF